MSKPSHAAEPAGEEDWLASLESTAAKVQCALEPYHGALRMSFGALACFYGRHFTYSVLFWKAFSTSGWHAARRAAAELRQRFRAAQVVARREFSGTLPTLQEAGDAARHTVARLQLVHTTYQSVQQGGDVGSMQTLASEVEALQTDLVPMRRATSALAVVSAELQPERVLELWRGLYAGILASVSTAMADGAALVGMGVNIGEAVAAAVNRVAAPWLHGVVDLVAARCSQDIQQVREDPIARRWVDLAVNGLCNSIGIAAAFFVDARVFAISNVRVGARIIASEAFALLHRKGILVQQPQPGALGERVVEWLLFGAGCYFQFVQGATGIFGVLWGLLWNGRRMPCPLRLTLGIPLLTETWLQAIVTAMRAGAV